MKKVVSILTCLLLILSVSSMFVSASNERTGDLLLVLERKNYEPVFDNPNPLTLSFSLVNTCDHTLYHLSQTPYWTADIKLFKMSGDGEYDTAVETDNEIVFINPVASTGAWHSMWLDSGKSSGEEWEKTEIEIKGSLEKGWYWLSITVPYSDVDPATTGLAPEEIVLDKTLECKVLIFEDGAIYNDSTGEYIGSDGSILSNDSGDNSDTSGVDKEPVVNPTTALPDSQPTATAPANNTNVPNPKTDAGSIAGLSVALLSASLVLICTKKK